MFELIDFEKRGNLRPDQLKDISAGDVVSCNCDCGCEETVFVEVTNRKGDYLEGVIFPSEQIKATKHFQSLKTLINFHSWLLSREARIAFHEKHICDELKNMLTIEEDHIIKGMVSDDNPWSRAAKHELNRRYGQ